MFDHPCTILVSGASNCGKSTFILKAPIYPKPKKIYYFYGAYNSGWKKLKDIEFIKGLPESDFEFKKDSLVILDDLMEEAKNCPYICELFTKHSHHSRLSVILVTHNLYCQGSQFRNISLNCNYMVIFKNVRDTNQISLLDRQMNGHGSTFLTNCYLNAVKRAFGYIVIDFRSSTHDRERLRTNILESDGPVVYYAKRTKSLPLVKKLKEKQEQERSVKKVKRRTD